MPPNQSSSSSSSSPLLYTDWKQSSILYAKLLILRVVWPNNYFTSSFIMGDMHTLVFKNNTFVWLYSLVRCMFLDFFSLCFCCWFFKLNFFIFFKEMGSSYTWYNFKRVTYFLHHWFLLDLMVKNSNSHIIYCPKN